MQNGAILRNSVRNTILRAEDQVYLPKLKIEERKEQMKYKI